MMSKLLRPFVFFLYPLVRALTGLYQLRTCARLRAPVLRSWGVLMAKMTFVDSSVTNNGAVESTIPKALFVVLDGILADVTKRVLIPGIDKVASDGSNQRAYVGGELGMRTESPTVSAVG